MSHASVKGALLRTVIDGQINTDCGDLHIAHQAVLPHIQKRVVALSGFYEGVLRVGLFRDGQQGFVIGAGCNTGSVKRRGVHLFNSLRVLRLNEAAVFLGQVVGNQRVENDAEGDDEQDGQR